MTGTEFDPRIDIFDAYKQCDGFVEDAPSAMIALSISCVSSVILILVIERMKLYFYQTSE